MGNDWTNRIPVKILIIAFIILLAALIAIIVVGLTTNKAIEVWFIKFNMKETIIHHDTTFITKHDTGIGQSNTNNPLTIPFTKARTSDSKKEPRNKDGKSEVIEVNAPISSSNVGGHDNTVNVTQERTLSKSEAIEVVNAVKSFISKNNLKTCINVSGASNSSPKIVDEIVAALNNSGLNAFINGYTIGVLDKFSMYKDIDPWEGCVHLTIGIYR